MALDLFAGIRVSDYETIKPWYERLLGAEPSFMAHAAEAVWELAEHRWLFIVEDAELAGRAIHTIFVDDLDARSSRKSPRAASSQMSSSRIPARRARRYIGTLMATRSASAARSIEVTLVAQRWHPDQLAPLTVRGHS